MKIAFFCHSFLSDWNNGNAHFLRGLVTELGALGHEVCLYEPRDAWSVRNLVNDHGAAALEGARWWYPGLDVTRYEPSALDLDEALDGASLVVVHEWNEPELVARIGEYRASHRGLVALFHDTHHRSVTDTGEMRRYDLSSFDGVLAFGEAVRDVYDRAGWSRRSWTFHEAADVRVFRPLARGQVDGDLVWIGNWGDEERTAELREFLIEPVRSLRLRARVHGVRYPPEALAQLAAADISFRGWVPNYLVPDVFARHRVTLHVPRRPYAERLPGIPTIRVFEALACGIPLVSAPWRDCEQLFSAGRDYLLVEDGLQMERALRMLVSDARMADELAVNGRRTILARHTCTHRARQLLEIESVLAGREAARASAASECTPCSAIGGGTS